MALSANTFPHPFPKISGYTLAEQLYWGSRTAVCRAVQIATQHPVVNKVLRPDYLQQQSLNLVNVLAIALQVSEILRHLYQDKTQQVLKLAAYIGNLQIGQSFLQNISLKQPADHLLNIVSQLNAGRALITDEAEQKELAQLNHKVAQKAIAATAYDAVNQYLHHLQKLLQPNSWKTQYELTSGCYLTITEVAYLFGDLSQMESFADLICQQTQTFLDTAKVCEIKIEAYSNQGDFAKAINIGLEFLHYFGIEFPGQPTKPDFVAYLAETETQPQQITIQTKQNENWIEVVIADTGPGIPEQIQTKIFDHLFITKGVGKGTGLGLAIARQIVVDNRGGTVAVDSQFGQGTGFLIRLPISTR